MNQITVRAFEMSDWEGTAELFLLPRCRWGTLQMPFQSRDDVRKKLENPPPDFHRLLAVDEEQRVYGLLGLRVLGGRRAHVGDVGMFVHDDHQGQGVGTKLMEACVELADQWLALQRMELTVFVDNAAAIALYEKFGFEREGTLRRYAIRGGEYVDTYAMARLREPGAGLSGE